MSRKKGFILLVVVVSLVAGYFFTAQKSNANRDFIIYEVDLLKHNLKLYWKDENGELFRSLGNLKNWTEGKGQRLLFAMNAGMFKADRSPQGLLIQQGKTVTALDTSSAEGNFYLKPNGVFYVTADNKAFITTTEEFPIKMQIGYATQSGPMLVIKGRLHPAFKKGSANLNIRNGVGLLPGGNVVFAMSKRPVNLYDFASFFKELGCYNALYLDGLVSRTYLPDQNWIQTDGDVGVIIGVTEDL